MLPAPPLATDGEAQRVRRALDGDREAFDDLYESWFDSVYGLSLRRTASRAEAERATAEILATALREIPSCEGEASPGAFLLATSLRRLRPRPSRQPSRSASLVARVLRWLRGPASATVPEPVPSGPARTSRARRRPAG